MDKLLDALGLEDVEGDDVIEGEFYDVDTEIVDDESLGEIVTSVAEEQAITNAAQEEFVDDIEVAKKNIKSIIEKATKSFDALVDMTEGSETARDFEVAANMMTALVAANKAYIDVAEKKKFAKEELPTQTNNTTNNVTNNNLILTSADMLKMIKGG